MSISYRPFLDFVLIVSCVVFFGCGARLKRPVHIQSVLTLSYPGKVRFFTLEANGALGKEAIVSLGNSGEEATLHDVSPQVFIAVFSDRVETYRKTARFLPPYFTRIATFPANCIKGSTHRRGAVFIWNSGCAGGANYLLEVDGSTGAIVAYGNGGVYTTDRFLFSYSGGYLFAPNFIAGNITAYLHDSSAHVFLGQVSGPACNGSFCRMAAVFPDEHVVVARSPADVVDLYSYDSSGITILKTLGAVDGILDSPERPVASVQGDQALVLYRGINEMKITLLDVGIETMGVRATSDLVNTINHAAFSPDGKNIYVERDSRELIRIVIDETNLSVVDARSLEEASVPADMQIVRFYLD